MASGSTGQHRCGGEAAPLDQLVRPVLPGDAALSTTVRKRV